MKIIKFTVMFMLFGITLNPSNNSNVNNDGQEGRISPYGLMPVLEISKNIQECEDTLSLLERQLSEKKSLQVEVIPLKEGLEGHSAKDNEGIEESPNALGDLQEESMMTFQKLCKKVSSLSLELHNRSNLSKAEPRIQSLFERLASLKREHHLPVDDNITCFVSDLDGEKGHLVLEANGVLQELEHLAATKESSPNLFRDDNGISIDESALGELKKSSLRLQIPRALSFKYLKIASSDDFNRKKETKRQSIFGEAVNSDDDSEKE